MTDQAREDLTELLRRFMDAPAAETTERDIRAGEAILDAHPAPAPDGRVVASIKAHMAAAGQGRHRHIRVFQGSLATAAAVVMALLIGLFGRDPGNGPTAAYASIIPAAVWESDDIASDDPDLLYFTSEIRQIEAQMQALEAGEGETTGSGMVEELEMELMRIDTEFWKG
jgi:hypothetical protein